MNKLIPLTSALAIGMLAVAPSARAASFYDVAVGDSFQIGSWSAATGSDHPTGAGNDLLYRESGGNFTTSTNFSSLRIFGSGGTTTDYTFGGRGGALDLDPFVTSHGASPISGIEEGFRTVWDIGTESLQVTQDVVVVGNTFANSAIYHTVELTNTGSDLVSLGWRNLYDWQVDDPGTDDGPSNQVERSDETVVVAETTNEFSHNPGTDEFVRVSVNPGTATYEPLLALGFDPGFLAAFPVTIPDEYAYVSWPGSVGTAFDYFPGASNVTGDSAGLSWFGRDAASAIQLGAGQSVQLTQIIFGVPPEAPIPGQVPEPGTIFGLLAIAGLGVKALHKQKES